MNGVRINETVTSSARALQDSVHSFIDIYNRQHPFGIPVSQVLRFEKDRGFKHGQPTEDGSIVYHFQRASCGGKRHLGTRPSSPGIGQTVTTPTSSPILPRHRSFSSFSAPAEKKKPQLPRRLPIPPRKPQVSSYGRSDPGAPEDDTLAKIAATTGRMYQNKSNNQQEQDRKRQNQIDKLDTPWHYFLRDVSGKLTVAEIEINILIQDTRAVRRNTLRKMEEIYNKFKSQVDDLKRQVQDRSKYIDSLPQEIRSKRKEAAKKGRQDYLFEQHSEATGLGPFRRGVDRVTYQLDVLRRQLADLKYTIDWTAWHQERLDFQLEELIVATRELKSAKASHNHLRDILDEFSVAQLEIDQILDRLRNNLLATSSSLSRSRRQRYLRITIRLATDIHYFGNVLHTECHLWRKLDRFALTESRFPEAIDHVVPEFEIDPLLARFQENTFKINRLISKVYGDKRMPPNMHSRWGKTYGPKDSLVDSTTEFRKIYKAFSVGGLTLLNPKLSSQFGRLKYAAFIPFESFMNALNESMGFSRGIIDKLKKQVDNHEKRNENHELRKRVQDVSTRFELAIKDSTSFKRDFIPLYHELGFEMVSRLVRNNYNDPNLERILSEVYARAKTEHDEARTSELQEAQAFNQLSRPAFYHDHMSANRLMDPVKLRGNDMLYPLKKNYPIEFISLEARVHQVLKGIPIGTVVGFDMLGSSLHESQNPLYISIATTEKVFLIDWDWSTKESASALTEFLENPDIIKVVHNTDILTSYLSSRMIRLRGVVGIDKQTLEKDVKSSSRLTSTGDWKPPEPGSSSWKSFFEFITDLAFLSTYNLWTFLSAATPEHVSPLRPDLGTNILQARERLHHKITTHNSSLVFGPVEWDHAGNFFKLKRAHNVERKSLNPLTTFTRLQAANDLSIKGEQRFLDDLAAYYMFTTFNEELSVISTMLEMDNVASHILEVAERFNLTIHPEDLRRLKDAPKEEASWTKAINTTSNIIEEGTQNLRIRRKRGRKSSAETKSENKREKSFGSQSGTKEVKTTPLSNAELEAKVDKPSQLKKPSKTQRQKGNRSIISPVRSVLSKGAGKPRNVLSGPIGKPVQSRFDKIKGQKTQNVLDPVKPRDVGRKAQSGRSLSRKDDLSKNQEGNQVGIAPSPTPHDQVSYLKRERKRRPKIAKDAKKAGPKTTNSQDEGIKDSKSDTTNPVPLLSRIPKLNDLTMRWFSPEKKEKSG